jgi:glycerol-3-phosphate acyltransferase PlsY
MMFFLGAVLSYLIGSIPTAYIIGRLYKGIDIRQHGSGNVGATNVFRVLGKWPGILVLAIDILKGMVVVTLVADVLHLQTNLSRILLAVIVVIGHNWTIFLGFKGGKGIATSLGVLIGLTIKMAVIRPVLFLTIFVWLATFLLSAYVSLASIVAAVCLPFFMLLTNQPFEIMVLGVVFCIFVVLRHRPNIGRLLNGQESQVPLPFRKNKS